MSEYEKWYEEKFKTYTVSKKLAMYGFVQFAWNHQQKKIEKLEAENKKLKSSIVSFVNTLEKFEAENEDLQAQLERERKCVDFYAEESNWGGMSDDKHNAIFMPPIDNEYNRDDKYFPHGFTCGKLARETQKLRKQRVR